jgi:signal recognition particle subunit SRP54
MFPQLTEKLGKIFDRVRGYGRLNEKNIDETLREVRLSLLEADVNFKVVKEFAEAVKTRALGQEVIQSLSPGQQFIKVVYEELTRVLGESQGLNLSFKPPVVILLVGLQGCGKTTTAAKLALYLKQKLKRSPFLVPADVYRPAAIEQLKILGERLQIPVYPTREKDDPVKVAQAAKKYAADHGYDVVILDTAGRLHIDDALMKELEKIKSKVEPQQIVFVADAMTGQEAVNVAQSFHNRLPLDGVILTKLDGDARGGAALSLRHVLGKPIFFVGMGEKVEDLEPFYPDRMASRVLGMGDMLTLIEQAQEKIDLEKAKQVTERVLKKGFTLADFQDQLSQMKRLGSLQKVVEMIPGVGKIKKEVNFEEVEKDLKKKGAIISSMTIQEKLSPKILNGSRRLRIAKGSGTEVADVNRLIKEFEQMKKMMDRLGKFGMKGLQQMAAGLLR